jgi:hypothetical protein
MGKLSPEEELYDFDFGGKLDPFEIDEMWNDWSDSSKNRFARAPRQLGRCVRKRRQPGFLRRIA